VTKPKMSTKTPDAAEVNNLIDLHDQIIDNPEGELLALVRILPVQVVHRVADGEDQATVALRQIEVLQGPDVDAGRKLMLKAFRARTKAAALPDLTEDGEPNEPLPGMEEEQLPSDTLQ
jgi:hypothetical protein